MLLELRCKNLGLFVDIMDIFDQIHKRLIAKEINNVEFIWLNNKNDLCI